MHQKWYTFLNELENNLKIFALCKEFDALSLRDKVEGESSSSQDTVCSSSSTSLVQRSSFGYRSTFHSFLRNFTHSSPWSHPFTEQLRAPFVELPRHYIDSSSLRSYDIRMGIGFRFLPGQPDFLLQELKFKESFDRFSFLSNSLGLSYFNRPISSNNSMLPFSRSGAGLRCLVTDASDFSKVLVEVVTHHNRRYGRFLVLVCLGIGCTVWYGFEIGSIFHPPQGFPFIQLDSYDPFFNMDYSAPGFNKISFVETHDVSASVESTFGNEPPFADIQIPASGPVLKAVSLGIMVAFFLAVGIVPNASGAINI
jgi:hypothetical protein